jgi:hypothetical protein
VAADGHRAGGLGELAVTPRPLVAYRDMFLLTDADLRAGPILDCPAGASPFGAQVRALGGEVTGVDPAYFRPGPELVERARADVRRVVGWQRANSAGFDWTYLGSPEAVGRAWEDAVEEFAADFAADGQRYVAAALPELPFPDGRFALAVSGFLLFAYPDLLDADAHLAALLELGRVTRGEVRVFPVHATDGRPYPHLDALRAELERRGRRSELRTARASYSRAADGNRMLVLTCPAPRVSR